MRAIAGQRRVSQFHHHRRRYATRHAGEAVQQPPLLDARIRFLSMRSHSKRLSRNLLHFSLRCMPLHSTHVHMTKYSPPSCTSMHSAAAVTFVGLWKRDVDGLRCGTCGLFCYLGHSPSLSPLPCSRCSAASWKLAACSAPPKGALVTVGVVIAKVLWMRFIALFVIYISICSNARIGEGKHQSMSPHTRALVEQQAERGVSSQRNFKCHFPFNKLQQWQCCCDVDKAHIVSMAKRYSFALFSRVRRIAQIFGQSDMAYLVNGKNTQNAVIQGLYN